MNFATIQSKKMLDMQEQAEAQQQESLPMMNSQVDENSRSS
jgi:hypothetical protein